MNYNEYDLIIAPPRIKNNILLECSNKHLLLKAKILDLDTLVNYLFGYPNDEALFYLVKEKNISIPKAKEYLNNIAFAPTFKDLKEELFLKGYLSYNKEILNNVNKILVINTYKIPKLISNILSEYVVTYYELDQETQNKIYEFATIEEEISFVATQILDNKISDLTKVHLVNITDSYYLPLKRIFSLYNIPINIPNENYFKKTEVGRLFLDNLRMPLKDNLELLPINDEYNELIDLLNKYNINDINDDNMEIVKDIIDHFQLKDNNISNAVDIINIEDIIDNNDYYYLLGFNDGIIPKVKKDDDYLSDKIKEKIGLLTSEEENELENNYVLNLINHIPNLVITYKLKARTEEFLPSSLIMKNNLEVIKNMKIKNNYANKINILNMGSLIDKFYKYNIIEDELKDYLVTYKNNLYLTYQNDFTGIDIVDDYLQANLVLSYSSLSEYYKCPFAYYLDKVLKVNKYADTFAIFVGNLFHYVLARIYDDDFDFESTYQEYLVNRNLTKEEVFLLSNLKQELIFDIEIIKNQDDNSLYKGVLTEKKVEILKDKYGLPFLGFIDKIKYNLVNDIYYVTIIDYKTGQDKPSLSNINDGLNLQLPIYTVLVKEIFPKSVLTGIYLQRILNKHKISESEEEHKKGLQLDGYTINDEEKIELFDENYKIGSMIKNMSLNADGTISKKAKLLTNAEFEQIENIVNEKIRESVKNILNGNFKINPKRLKDKNISCEYCAFKDICYKKEEDIQDINYEPFNNKEEGEEDANLD